MAPLLICGIPYTSDPYRTAPPMEEEVVPPDTIAEAMRRLAVANKEKAAQQKAKEEARQARKDKKERTKEEAHAKRVRERALKLLPRALKKVEKGARKGKRTCTYQTGVLFQEWDVARDSAKYLVRLLEDRGFRTDRSSTCVGIHW